jgi:hypothetical protein
MTFPASAVLDDIAELLVAFGERDGSRAAVYAKWVATELECLTCVRQTIEMLYTERGLPTLRRVEEEYQRRRSDLAHASHDSESDRHSAIERREFFWRKQAPKAIASVLPELSVPATRWLAARMWFSETVAATEHAVIDEFAFPRPIWPGLVPAEVETAEIDQLYADAREIAMDGYRSWWDRHHGQQRLEAAGGRA